MKKKKKNKRKLDVGSMFGRYAFSVWHVFCCNEADAAKTSEHADA